MTGTVHRLMELTEPQMEDSAWGEHILGHQSGLKLCHGQSPTWATTSVPSGSTTTWRVLLAFTLEVLSCVGNVLRQEQQFPYSEFFSADAASSGQVAW